MAADPQLLSYAFVTEAQLQAVCSATSADQNTMNRFANAVTAYMEKRLHRQIKARAYVETFRGNGKTTRSVRHPPIEEASHLTAVTIEYGPTVNPASDSEVRIVREGDNRHVVHLLQTVFPSGNPNNCSLTYEGGWHTVPVDLVEWCLQATKLLYAQKGTNRELVKAITVGGETTHYHVRKALGRTDMLDLIQNYELMRLECR